jgi:hypothetical protein
MLATLTGIAELAGAIGLLVRPPLHVEWIASFRRD